MGEIPRAEADASPRIGLGGEAKRDRPIFEQSSAEPPWKVQVVPLPRVHTTFRLESGDRSTTFEVRAEFEGKGLEAFEPVAGKVKRVESWTTHDLELAQAMAIAAVDELRAGREPVLVQLVGRFTE